MEPFLSSTSGFRLQWLEPYWHRYRCALKSRWLGRELLEVMKTEFRGYPPGYHVLALQLGLLSINCQRANPFTVLTGVEDQMSHFVHRHEPPITTQPIQILAHDTNRGLLVVNKPSGIPVHSSGRYTKHTLLSILRAQLGMPSLQSVNRLDALTSGVMILPMNTRMARILSTEIKKRQVEKHYLARCQGQFPSGEIVCDQPLMKVDSQIGLVIVHPDGLAAKTVFRRITYDNETDTSLVACMPITGRLHQIRVHLQYLGHPIANDRMYSDPRVWGEALGKHGVHHVLHEDPNSQDQLSISLGDPSDDASPHKAPSKPDLHFNIPPSKAVADIVARKRAVSQMPKQEAWMDYTAFIGGLLHEGNDTFPGATSETQERMEHSTTMTLLKDYWKSSTFPNKDRFCPECLLPLDPAPQPDDLQIYLHAMKYVSPALGTFEAPLPYWASGL